AELEADQGDQADEPRRRVLARRRAQQAADADLRDGVLFEGGPRPLSRAARGGAEARPPPDRPAARPLPPERALTRLAVLAPQGNGDLERPRGSAQEREPEARLHGSENPAALRHRDVHHVGALRELQGE